MLKPVSLATFLMLYPRLSSDMTSRYSSLRCSTVLTLPFRRPNLPPRLMYCWRPLLRRYWILLRSMFDISASMVMMMEAMGLTAPSGCNEYRPMFWNLGLGYAKSSVDYWFTINYGGFFFFQVKHFGSRVRQKHKTRAKFMDCVPQI